jgi:predicted enzyme related to lactoylglutathione lyase
MDPVVHFEFPAEDRKRMGAFYKKAFGWKITHLGEESMNYTLAQTTEVDKKGMVKTKGAINGGFFEKKKDWPAQYPSVVVAVKDIKRSMKKVAASGGKVLGEPMMIPGYGLYVSFLDTEGNRISIMQPVMKTKKK